MSAGDAAVGRSIGNELTVHQLWRVSVGVGHVPMAWRRTKTEASDLIAVKPMVRRQLAKLVNQVQCASFNP